MSFVRVPPLFNRQRSSLDHIIQVRSNSLEVPIAVALELCHAHVVLVQRNRLRIGGPWDNRRKFWNNLEMSRVKNTSSIRM
jgi:hypothetical protein